MTTDAPAGVGAGVLDGDDVGEAGEGWSGDPRYVLTHGYITCYNTHRD